MNEFTLDVRVSDAPLAREGAREVAPVIDGRDLIDLITRFEEARRFDPPGGYGGILVGGWFLGQGSLRDYFLGQRDSPIRRPGTIAVLGCSCGDVECWPLYTNVHVDDARVTWSRFLQPYRRERGYDGFGSFFFDRGDYERAIADAVAVLRLSGR